MIHRILPLALLLTTAFALSAQPTWQWGHAFGGGGFTEIDAVSDMVVDHEGNSYLVGCVGPGFTLLDSLYQGFGLEDLLLISFDCNGAYRWHKLMGSSTTERVSSFRRYWLAVDSSGLYMAVSVGMGPGRQFDMVDTILPSPKANTILVKYTHTGEMEWLQDFGGNSLAIRTFPYGLQASGNNLNLLLQTDSVEIQAGLVLNEGIYVLELDKQGQITSHFEVSPSFYSVSELVLSGLGVTDSGAKVIGGYVTGGNTATIGGQVRGPGAFVARFGPQGGLDWLVGQDGGGSSALFDIKVDSTMVVFSGFMTDTMVIQGRILVGPANTGSDAVLVAIDLAGNFIEALYPVSASSSSGSYACNVYSESIYFSTTSIGPQGYGMVTVPGGGPYVLQLPKDFSKAGLIQMNVKAGSFKNRISSIAIDRVENVYVAGHFESELYIDKDGLKIDTLHNLGGGSEDLFVAKWGTEACVDTTGDTTGIGVLRHSGPLAQVSVFPHPVAHTAQVQVWGAPPRLQGAPLRLHLTDMYGRPAAPPVALAWAAPGSAHGTLDAAPLPRGVYLWRIMAGHEAVASGKVVVQ